MMRGWFPQYYRRHWLPYRVAYSRRGPGLKWVYCEEKKDLIMPLGECEKCPQYANWSGEGPECKYDWQARKEEQELTEEEENGLVESQEASGDEDMEEETEKENFYPYLDREDMDAYYRFDQLMKKEQSKGDEDEEDE